MTKKRGSDASASPSDPRDAPLDEGVASEDSQSPRRHLEELLNARGIGVEMAAGIDPDEYIRELRDGWDERDQMFESIYAEIEANKAKLDASSRFKS